MRKNKQVGNNSPQANLTTALIDLNYGEQEPLTVEKLRGDLTELNTTANQMLQEPARLGRTLKNVIELKANLTETEFSELTVAAGVLVKDLVSYRASLEALDKESQALDWSCTDLMELQQPVIFIYEKYNDWITSFTTVVLPVAAAITGLLTLASNNKKASLKSES